MFKRGCVLLLLLSASACGGTTTTSPTPTPTSATPTRIIGLSGNLAFGNVTVGQQSAPTTLTITNSGNSTLTLSRMTITSGLETVFTPTLGGGGTVPAGGSQQVTITFAPPVAQSYSGTVTVNGDQTSGTNTISISGTGTVTSVLVTLSGTITDRTSGAPIVNATVRVVSGVNVGVSATSDSAGHYSLSPLVAGSFLIDVTASGYQSLLSQPIAIDRDTPFNTTLAKIAPSVEYRITGTARRCSATYQNSTGGINQSEVNIPFSYSWSGARSGDFLYMACQIDTGGDTGSITIGLYKNGNLVQSATANGFPNIATVSGSY